MTDSNRCPRTSREVATVPTANNCKKSNSTPTSSCELTPTASAPSRLSTWSKPIPPSEIQTLLLLGLYLRWLVQGFETSYMT